MFWGTIAMMSALIPTPGLESDVAVDLFLVAGNSKSISGVDLLKSPDDGGVVSVLREALQPLVKAKTGFIVVDGGDCSVFPKDSTARTVSISHREYSSYDAMTQSVTIKGKTKTQVLARSETESTSTATFQPRPLRKGAGYISQSFEYFGNPGENRPLLAFQDLNSYQSVLDRGMEQERKTLGNTIAITGDSVEATKAYLANHKGEFNGVCICPWGLPDSSSPNILAFPPKGLVGHYKLFRKEGRWGVSWVEYLGNGEQSAYSLARGTSSTRY